MKCNNCGSILLVGTTVCPYCNTPQDAASNEQVVSPVDTQPAEMVSQVNETPVATPVVDPMTTETTMMATPSVSDLGVDVAPVQPEPTPAVVANEVTPDVAPMSVTPDIAPMAVTPEVQPVAPTPVEATPVSPMTDVAPATPVEATPMPVPQNNVPVDGGKIANTAAVPPKKGGKKIGLILAIVIVVLAGLVAMIYFYEFKSSDKRIDIIFNELTNSLTKNTQTDITKTSGKYNISAKANVMGQEAKIALDGTYGIDIDNKIIDYTLNLTDLFLGESLIPEKLTAGVYVNDDKIYLNVDNFYNKIVSMDFDGSEELFKNKDTDINTNLIIKSMSNALRDGVKAMDNKQTVEDITLDGKKQKANVITINLTSANQYKFTKALYDSIINNTAFLEEIAKLADVSVEELKSAFAEPDNSGASITDDAEVTVKIASPLVGNDLLGIVLLDPTDSANRIEIVSIKDGFKLVAKTSEVNFNIELTSSEKKDSKVTTSDIKLKGEIEVEGQKVSLELSIVVEEDNEPVINKKNVKNSIALENITTEELESIYEKVTEFGALGDLLSEYLNPDIGDDDWGSDWDYDWDDDDYDFDYDWDID